MKDFFFVGKENGIFTRAVTHKNWSVTRKWVTTQCLGTTEVVSDNGLMVNNIVVAYTVNLLPLRETRALY